MAVEIKKKLWEVYGLDKLKSPGDKVEVDFSIPKTENALRRYCFRYFKKHGISVSVNKVAPVFIITRIN